MGMHIPTALLTSGLATLASSGTDVLAVVSPGGGLNLLSDFDTLLAPPVPSLGLAFPPFSFLFKICFLLS